MSQAVSRARPVLRVIKGDPSAEELAAVIAVLASRGRTATAVQRRGSESAWAAYWRTANSPVRLGPGAWRSSTFPR